MLPIISKESPPRYVIAGAESDSDEPMDEQLANEVKTVQVATTIFSNPEAANPARIELQINFKNPFKLKNNTTRIQMNAAQYHFDRAANKVACVFKFPQDKDPVFFAYDNDARYTKVLAKLTGYKAEKKAIVLEEFTSYFLLDANSEYTVASDNLHFRVKLIPLTDGQKQRLVGPKRRLNFDNTEDSLSCANSPEVERKMSNIFVLESAKLDISLSSPE